MIEKLNPIIQHFMSIVLILSGTLLLINYFKKTVPADWNDAILWIAISNIVVGLAAYFIGLKQRRDALKELQSDKSKTEGGR